LLTAIDGFFKLLSELDCSEEALKLGFAIRRCEYQGKPANVKTLTGLLGWKTPTLLRHFAELQKTWGYWKQTDEKDGRQTILRVPVNEPGSTTAFFDKCLAVVDTLVLDRETARKLLPRSDPWSRIQATVCKMARVACYVPVVLGGLLAGWLTLDPDPMDDVQELATLIVDDVVYDGDALVDTFVGSERISFTKSPKRLPQHKAGTAVDHLLHVKRPI
jgi:hypothetical protein